MYVHMCLIFSLFTLLLYRASNKIIEDNLCSELFLVVTQNTHSLFLHMNALNSVRLYEYFVCVLSCGLSKFDSNQVVRRDSRSYLSMQKVEWLFCCLIQSLPTDCSASTMQSLALLFLFCHFPSVVKSKERTRTTKQQTNQRTNEQQVFCTKHFSSFVDQ